MRRRHVPIGVLLIMVTGCGPGAADVPNPSPPTAALEAWSDFPADHSPRPIVLLDQLPHYPGFTTGGGKIAAYCGRFRWVGASEIPPGVPSTAAATWPDGTRSTFGAISAVAAYDAIVGAPVHMTSSDCALAQPLEVTAARLGTAGVQTDRGTAQMSAWLFTITGATSESAYPAIAKAAFWSRPATSGPFTQSSKVSGDGRTLSFGFVGGECDAGYKSAVAESVTAVAVAVVAIPQGGFSQVCSAVGVFRSLNIALASPLGGRVVVDGSGAVEPVCPEVVGSPC
jgi:hypothetical protein